MPYPNNININDIYYYVYLNPELPGTYILIKIIYDIKRYFSKNIFDVTTSNLLFSYYKIHEPLYYSTSLELAELFILNLYP